MIIWLAWGQRPIFQKPGAQSLAIILASCHHTGLSTVLSFAFHGLSAVILDFLQSTALPFTAFLPSYRTFHSPSFRTSHSPWLCRSRPFHHHTGHIVHSFAVHCLSAVIPDFHSPRPFCRPTGLSSPRLCRPLPFHRHTELQQSTALQSTAFPPNRPNGQTGPTAKQANLNL